MVFLIASLLLVVGIVFTIWTQQRYFVWPYLLWMLSAVAILVAAVAPAAALPNGVYGMVPNTLSSERSILALGHQSETSGSFFLGTGTVDEEQVYVYVADSAIGAEMLTIEVRKARIVEEEGDPHIEEWRYCGPSVWVPWNQCSAPLTVFHIPPGSITRDFTIAP